MYMLREKLTWMGNCSQRYPFKNLAWLVTEPEAVGCACVADRWHCAFTVNPHRSVSPSTDNSLDGVECIVYDQHTVYDRMSQSGMLGLHGDKQVGPLG